ncbi:MAG: hypothetical protein JST59_29310 [Actinobacteria bacterium]|nr:hypothetical protein [Actinomycetota bacterium]
MLTLAGCAIAVVAVIVLLRGGGSSEDGAAILQADRRTRDFIVEDQRPHSARIPGGPEPRQALEQAILADIRRRVRDGDLGGPSQSVHCERFGARHEGRIGFRCTARAGGFPYPYLGVAEPARHRLTWCKVDLASEGEVRVPVNSRCEV